MITDINIGTDGRYKILNICLSSRGINGDSLVAESE
ncbi:MAG: hypothetical protein ACJAYW_002087 [Candidatus Azotimanducaceae bacterium]|jgi:hypothetical protein